MAIAIATRRCLDDEMKDNGSGGRVKTGRLDCGTEATGSACSRYKKSQGSYESDLL